MFPAQLDDYVTEDNPVRAVDVFIDGLDLAKLDFKTVPLTTGRPGYHPATMLKIYVYGYLNRIPSSRRLERECQQAARPVNHRVAALIERDEKDRGEYEQQHDAAPTHRIDGHRSAASYSSPPSDISPRMASMFSSARPEPITTLNSGS